MYLRVQHVSSGGVQSSTIAGSRQKPQPRNAFKHLKWHQEIPEVCVVFDLRVRHGKRGHEGLLIAAAVAAALGREKRFRNDNLSSAKSINCRAATMMLASIPLANR